VIGSKVPSARKPEAIYVIFGRRLRELREKNRLPQEELAAFSGLTRSSIANIENGKQRVMLHQLIKFAEVLRVDLDALVPVKSQEFGMQEAKQDYLDHLRILARPNTRREPRR
jgi:transcriptional regulator with XRE-family HTH domain